ncbi:MAG: flippase [Nitrospirae bacterium]|nr:MAG: flippase [Nitrospirota bacterium]
MPQSFRGSNQKGVQPALSSPSTSGRLLAHNTLLTLAGQVIPLVIALSVIPVLLKGLGTDRFGVLTLSWMVLGYFSLFDLGLGRATTRFVAEALGKNETGSLPELIWTSFSLHLMLGITTGLILALLTPLLAGRILRISPEMIGDAITTFLILSAAIPVILASTVLRGVLEASQRFDLINMVQIPAGSLTFLLPLAGLFIGFGLPGIVALLMLARLGAAFAYLLLCMKVFPVLRNGYRFDRRVMRPLLSFGGWITVSNIVGPVLIYLDRFMLGALVSMAAVAYYTAPFEVVTRLMVFPMSLIMVLFPVFSAAGNLPGEQIARLYTRSIKYLLLVMGPVLLIMILFAGQILSLWLGSDVAEKSTLAFQILAAGMLLTPVQVSVSLLQGIGRPDISAKFYLLELLFYLPMLWFLVRGLGIPGAALAWTLKALIDTILLFIASGRFYDIGTRVLSENGLLRGIFALMTLAVLFSVVHFSGLALRPQIVMAAGALILFGLVSWYYVLDGKDRALLHAGSSGS